MKAFELITMQGPSKILDRRWKEKEAAIHRRKLTEVRSNIRKQQTLSYGPSENKKANKLLMQECKFKFHV